VTIFLFALGLAFLVLGAEALVGGAVRLGRAAGISSLVIGLTVVSFGTSAPELAVSVRAALAGPATADIAVGNAVGSNIFNVLFILGISAVITPLVVAQRVVRIEAPIMIAASAMLLVMARDGTLSRLNGAVLFLGILAYTTAAILKGRADDQPGQAEHEAECGMTVTGPGPMVGHVALILGGLALLVIGSRWLVNGAVALATALGVSDLVISLTIVAAGTSLPEVATSVVAALKGERDIAVGNVIGSNIFNILAVLGLSALVSPGLAVSAQANQLDIPVMLAVAVLCLPVFFTGGRIARLEGLLFLGYYALYLGYLVLTAAAPHAAVPYRNVSLRVVLPLTLVTITLTAARQVRAARRGRGLV